MRSHLQNIKLRSLRELPRLLAFGVGMLALSGCIIVDDNSNGTTNTNTSGGNNGNQGTPTTTDPMLENIDADFTLDATPGDGVGVFVEYTSGGRYRIWTTCDTTHSGTACPFDIYTSVDDQSTITATTEENLEGYDSVTVNASQGTADLHFETDSDYDAVTLDVTPGAVLRVETYLDGMSQPHYVYWFGDGILHVGAPTNPIDFVPNKP